MARYKSDFTKNTPRNYDLFIKGPAVLLSRDDPNVLIHFCLVSLSPNTPEHVRDILFSTNVVRLGHKMFL